jgi:hypothetical protein
MERTRMKPTIISRNVHININSVQYSQNVHALTSNFIVKFLVPD